MSMKPMNKALSMVDSFAKRATKTVVKTLPLVTVGANVADIASTANNLPDALDAFVGRYTGFSIVKSDFNASRLNKGALPLIGSVVISKLVQMFL